ncbi:hypothetical protein [Xanthomonas hortorum]|uniref:Uncharacterized protein n=1 Tax=Xanthomonas hortorum pv. vitians TaxID=83224 RepID=A0AAW8ZVJ1_9XANT|nr:hypothetical protein [Xanthomonas hortorum]MCE4303634.1 hypothetical protein [Xanthomonas hortorum pv. vitians]MCE4308890.1 hypothetical protein [Xanthomonas hortorum pv. vitians]MCE4339474.1 hypothetical protein [Xanthomonas hortorum pv. vitians]MCE4508460.1 hypothetical protein [Xanthomonas hortorum pv. vitians]MCE4552448.1 hypothetical protein [Xanthomonas hortorum pv. vitians]
MELLALLWDKFDPGRSRIKRDVKGVLNDLAGLEKNIKLLRASLESVEERCQLLKDQNDAYKVELDSHKLRLKSIDAALLRSSGSSLSGAPSLFNILLSMFIVLLICGASAVLNPAVDQEVIDYTIFNLPILAAIFAGFGLYINKRKRIIGLPGDAFFFCFSVILLVIAALVYAGSKGYLSVMALHSVGVYPAVIAVWLMLGIRRNFNCRSWSHMSALVVSIMFLTFATLWIYVINEHNPHGIGEIFSNFFAIFSSK